MKPIRRALRSIVRYGVGFPLIFIGMVAAIVPVFVVAIGSALVMDEARS